MVQDALQCTAHSEPNPDEFPEAHFCRADLPKVHARHQGTEANPMVSQVEPDLTLLAGTRAVGHDLLNNASNRRHTEAPAMASELVIDPTILARSAAASLLNNAFTSLRNVQGASLGQHTAMISSFSFGPIPFSQKSAPQTPPHAIQDLQASLAALHRRVEQLSDEVATARSIADAARSSMRTSIHDFNAASVRSTRGFLRRVASKTLEAGSIELGRIPTSPCAADSVKQILLKSSSSDCTLRNFQLLAKYLTTISCLKFEVFPSDYHVAFPAVERAKRFEIVFRSYFDICKALCIDAQKAEEGL